MAILVEHAPAKVNLTLAVLGRRADGYHLLDSLVVFAGEADRLTLAPGKALSLTVRGLTAKQAGPLDDNLVLKAARRLAAEIPGPQARRASRWTSGCRWRRGWAAARPMPAPRFACWPAPIASRSAMPRLQKVARRIGADVPVCVDAASAADARHRRNAVRAADDPEACGGAGQSGRRGADQGCVRDAGPQGRAARRRAAPARGLAARPRSA